MNGKIRSIAWALFLSLVGVFAAGAAAPEEKESRKPEIVEGIIKAVDPANNTFILMEKQGDALKEMKVTINQKTDYWLDNKPATMNDALKAGNGAVVSHLDGLAIKVHVKSKPV